MSALGSWHFDWPWLLGLGAPLLLLALWRAWQRPPAALAWPALPEALFAGAGRPDPVRLAAAGLRALAALALLAVLAGPLRAGTPAAETRDGLDLVLVVDASGSMRALDAEVESVWQRRLDLARAVVGRFALDRVAEGDRVALVVFGDSAFTLCPLTHDGRLLRAALDRLEAGMAGEATALGDALALAVKRVAPRTESALPASAAPGSPGAPRAGHLVVLLTDGRANAGVIPPDVAAAVAARAGIRVHTVGIGSGGEVAMATPGGGRKLRLERHDLDLATLRTIADATGGRSFTARTSLDLAEVYAAIDELERVPRRAPPRPSGDPRPEPLLAAAGLLLALELALARVAARRLP